MVLHHQPQSGVLEPLRGPCRGTAAASTPASRLNSEVSTHYDAMLAKVIAHAPTREQAARKLL